MAELKPWGAGEPDKRLSLDKPNPSAVQDGYGQTDLSDSDNWIVLGVRWARVLNTAQGKEPTVGDQVIALEQFQVWFRWEPNLPINPTWRFRYGERVWNILAVANWGEKNQWFKAICVEVRS